MDNFNQKFPLIITIFLIVSLILNAILLLKVNNLYKDIANIDSDISSLREHINYEMTQSDTGDRDDNTDEWLTPVEIEVIDNTDQSKAVRLSWQVKEYTEDEPVTFYYRKTGETDYNAITANSSGGGNFYVDLQVSPELEPTWDITYHETDVSSSVTGDVKDESVQVVQKQKEKPADKYRYDYYISTRSGSTIKTTERNDINLDKAAQGVASLDVNVYQEEICYRISMVEVSPTRPITSIKNAYLEIQKNGKTIEEESFTAKSLSEPGYDWIPTIYELRWNAYDTDFDKMLLWVEYDNGNTVFKEI